MIVALLPALAAYGRHPSKEKVVLTFWLSALCPEILLKEEPYNLLSLCSVEYCSFLENICFFLLVIGGLLAVWLRKAQTSRYVKVAVIVSLNAQAFLTKNKNC